MPLDLLLMTALSSERHFSDAGARLNYLQQALAQTLASSYLKRIRWKAYIYQHGSSQREQIKLYRTQLENAYGFDRGHTEISRNSDVGDFLRK
ncbi:MAG: hypothetical protein JO125_02575 [Chloroflexi bacterium]|nr:hypothetical protein [Chloroflexota bacterium]